MSIAVVLGAGEIGSAAAHKLALGARFREVRLIDAAAGIAEGKALDIRQSGPIDRFDTVLTGHTDPLVALTGDVVIVADAIGQGEWTGESGLALLRQLARAGLTTPLVFAGSSQVPLLETAVRELGIGRDRVIGSAASALVNAAQALVALEVNGSANDVSINIVGRPGAFVIAWSAATISGSLASEQIAPHRMLAVSERLRKLAPGPQAIGAATARIAEALAFSGRRRVPAMSVLDGEYSVRGRAAMLPLELGNGRILNRIQPSLSPQERVEFLNGLERRA